MRRHRSRRAAATQLARLASAVVAAMALGLAVVGLAVAAGPPFPPPVNDQSVYDTAEAFRPATRTQVESRIDAIEQRTGARSRSTRS
jgi:uncharacterized membrane protein YgcG